MKIHSLVSVSDQRLVDLQKETSNDVVLQKLKVLVRNGWPASIKQLDQDLCAYWPLRDDISVLDDLVMCGSRIVIPSIARKRTLRSIKEMVIKER